jgi:ribosomal protein S18 acetylase RimI-like enzyme
VRLAAAAASLAETAPEDERPMQGVLFGSLFDDGDGDDDGDLDVRATAAALPLEVRPLATADPSEVAALGALQTAAFSPHLESMGSGYLQQRLYEQSLKDADCALVALLPPDAAAALLANEGDNEEEDGDEDGRGGGAAAVAAARAKAKAAAAAADAAAARADAPVVVGGAQAARVPLGGQSAPLDVWYVSGVVVHAKGRGRGVGRALVDALVAAARTAEPAVGAVCLHVAPANAAAVALYRGAGFTDYWRGPLGTGSTGAESGSELVGALLAADGAHEGEVLMALRVVPE